MKTFAALAGIGAASLAAFALTNSPQSAHANEKPSPTVKLAATKCKATPGGKLDRAVFAGGCFWGLEKHFRATKGVTATASGYIDGKYDNPTYKEVCNGDTGHAEAVMVEFDPLQISYRQLVDRFWEIHNPCTLNSQGPDFGSQYRSGIYPLSAMQTKVAGESMADAAKLFRRPIVTEVKENETFFMAEDYHQQYAEKTGRSCAIDRSDHLPN